MSATSGQNNYLSFKCMIICMTVAFVAVCCINAESSIDLKGAQEIRLKTKAAFPRGSRTARTVSRFARHDLCRHRRGQVYFYNVLKPKLCGMNDSFVETFVSKLCNKKGKLLELVAGALFDSDSDGYVTDLERNLYLTKLD